MSKASSITKLHRAAWLISLVVLATGLAHADNFTDPGVIGRNGGGSIGLMSTSFGLITGADGVSCTINGVPESPCDILNEIGATIGTMTFTADMNTTGLSFFCENLTTFFAGCLVNVQPMVVTITFFGGTGIPNFGDIRLSFINPITNLPDPFPVPVSGQVTLTPEPSSIFLLLTGLCGILAAGRRKWILHRLLSG